MGGGIKAVVNGMQQHPSNAKVQHHGCGALRSLALDNVDNQTAIAAAGGIEALLNGMQQRLSSAKLEDSRACIVCMDALADTAIKPCFHAHFCKGCATQCLSCPTCRVRSQGIQRIYM